MVKRAESTLESEIKDLVREHENGAKADKEASASFDALEVDAVTTLFSRIPPDQGFYVKVYKRAPVPKEYGNRPLFLLDIQQPDLIQDMEAELLRLAKIHGWGDGVYDVKLFKHGEPGVREAMRITIQLPSSPPISSIPSDPNAPQVDVFAQLQNTAKLINELTRAASPQNNNPQNTETVVRAVTDAYRAGVETAKTSAPTPTPAQAPFNFLDLLKALKELAPPPKPEPDMLKIVHDILAMAPKPQPVAKNDDNDFFHKLVLLKEAGLLGAQPTSSVDPTTKAIELLSSLLPLMNMMNGGGGGGKSEPTSVAVELIRTLAPQVGKVVGDVTSTINRAIDAKTNPPLRRASPVTSAPIHSELLGPQSPSGVSEIEMPNVSTLETPMLPIFRPIKEAIEVRDVSYFPKLQEIILKYGSEDTFEDLIDGKFTIDQLAEYIRPIGGEFFTSEPAKIYFTDFLTWARAQRAQEIEVKCPTCNAEFFFDSKEALALEPACPECGVNMVEPSRGIPDVSEAVVELEAEQVHE